jgi:hypothetical protein
VVATGAGSAGLGAAAFATGVSKTNKKKMIIFCIGNYYI